MRVRTVRAWYDKLAGITREPGEVVEMDRERYEEVTKTLKEHKDTLWIEPVEEVKSLEDHTVAELKEILDKRGIDYDSRVKKADLIELLA